MNKTPKIRFKEFSDEWKTNTLEDLFSFKNGLNKEKEFFGKGYPIVNFTDVYRNRGLKVENIKGLVDVNEKELANFNVLKGDVFFTRTSETIDDIGMSAVILDDVENTVFSGFVLRARPKNSSLTSGFKKYCFSTFNARKEIVTKSSFTTRALTSGTLLNGVEINFPSIDEQDKIASFFSLIDKKIELQTEKVEALKEYKKGMMQKIFPKNGETIPELRFEGFTGAWGQRKIKYIFPEIKSGNRLPKTNLSEGTIPYVIAQVTNNGVYMNIDLKTKDYHGNNMKLFDVPCITLSIDNPKAMFIQTTPFYTSNIMRILYNSELELEHYHFILEQIKLLVTYFDWSFKFSGPVIMESEILVPINDNEIHFAEIKKIGRTLIEFNNLITLHQRKLDELNEYKKGLLQQMFV